MPRAPFFKRSSHHDKGDKVSVEEFFELQESCEALRDQVEDAEENLQLAKISARTLQEHFREELADVSHLRAALTESESQVSELELQAAAAEQSAAAAEQRAAAAEQSVASRSDASLAEHSAELSELESRHAAAEERHKQIVARLAQKATADAADADDTRGKLAKAERTLAEARAEMAAAGGSSAEEIVEARNESASLRDRLDSFEEEAQRLRAAASERDEDFRELREALASAREAVEKPARPGEAAAAESAAEKTWREELAEGEEQQHAIRAEMESKIEEVRNAAEEQQRSLRLELDARREIVAQPFVEAASSTIATSDRELEGQLQRRDETIADLERRLELAEMNEKATAHSHVREPSEASLPASPANGVDLVTLSTETAFRPRSQPSQIGELEEEIHDLREQLGRARDDSFKQLDMNMSLEEGLQEVRNERAELKAKVEDLEAGIAKCSAERLENSENTGRVHDDSLKQLDINMSLEERLQEAGTESSELKSKVEDLEVEIARFSAERLENSENAGPKVPYLEEHLSPAKGHAEQENLARSEAAQEMLSQREKDASQRAAMLLLELVDAQADCESLREELDQASELANENGAAAEAAKQASSRAAEFLVELAAADAAAEAAKGELVAAAADTEAAEAREKVARRELAEARGEVKENELQREKLTELEAHAAKNAEEAEELQQQLERDGASRSEAATIAAGGMMTAHSTLKGDAATAEATTDRMEAMVEQLRSELTEETSELRRAKASLCDRQAESDTAGAEAALAARLRMELAAERQRSAAAEVAEAARAPGSEVEELKATIEDLQFEVNTWNTFAEDSGGEPPGLAEAVRLRSECRQLEAELRRAAVAERLLQANEAAAAAHSATEPISPPRQKKVSLMVDDSHDESPKGELSGRKPRKTADFGTGSPAHSLRQAAGEESGHGQLEVRSRSTPSFAKSPVDQHVSSDDESEGSGTAASFASQGPKHPSNASFAPPPRTAAAEASNPFEEDLGESSNPFELEEAAPLSTSVALGNPFGQEEEANGNPFEAEPAGFSPSPGATSPGNPFSAGQSETSSPPQPKRTPSSKSWTDQVTQGALQFQLEDGVAMGSMASGDDDMAARSASVEGSAAGATPGARHASSFSFGCPQCGRDATASSELVDPSELVRLRAALQTEEKACVEAKAACDEARAEAARGAKRALGGADSDDVRQLRLALSDEAAKSRRLCEHALRAEESKRRLYHELIEDSEREKGEVDNDLVQLATLVGRATRAIAAVSEVAPRMKLLTAASAAAPTSPSAQPRATPTSAAAPLARTAVGQQALASQSEGGTPGRQPSPRSATIGEEVVSRHEMHRASFGAFDLPAPRSGMRLPAMPQTPSFTTTTSMPVQSMAGAAPQVITRQDAEDLR